MLPFSADANTKSSSAPDSDRKFTYLPVSISEMLTQVCAELTHVTEALWVSLIEVTYGTLPYSGS